MIGNLSYEQIEKIITIMKESNSNLKDVISQYSNEEVKSDLSVTASKLLGFCNELDQYTINLSNRVSLDKDASFVVNRLIEKTKV